MREKSDAQLLHDYAKSGLESAFREIVMRYTAFVYSAGLRQVESADLAADIAQGVFVDLARKAGSVCERMSPDGSLAGWLHRATRFAALNHIRDRQRRVANERQAMEQLLNNSDAPVDWEQIRPALDEALDSLEDDDREALLLRYFKNQDLRTVGLALGVSDDAAQKRVSRAVDQLRDFFSKRGVTAGAGGLAVAISTNAVQAVPAGLMATISTAALAGTAVSTTTTLIGSTTTIAMTTLQKTLVAITVAGLAGIGAYEAIQVSKSRTQIKDMEKQHSTLTEQYQDLEAEYEDVTNRLALVADALANTKPVPAELLRLRGEVSKLQKESIEAGTKSALNKITADPQSRELLRTQQKKGMEAIYSDFSKRLNLPPESQEALYDLLADHIMDNIDLITAVLRDGASPQELDSMFNSLDADLVNNLRLKLGDETAEQYDEYTSNLIAALSSSQFAKMLDGEPAEKGEKKDKFAKLIIAETKAVLAEAGLPANYQAIPMLNLRNIASEPRGEQSIQLLDSIYQRVAAQSAAFLSEEELNKFDKFRQEALDNSRMMLTMNRKMMQPIAQ